MTTEDPHYPSLDLVLDVLRAGQAERRAHADGLDQRAGLALGFAGVLVTLSKGIADPWRAIGATAAIAAAGLALSAFWPRQLPTLGDVRKYLAGDVDQTRLALVSTFDEIGEFTDRVDRTKAFRLKVALVALATAVLMLGIGVIVAGSGRP